MPELKFYCQNNRCLGEVKKDDQFCSTCGCKLDWSLTSFEDNPMYASTRPVFPDKLFLKEI